MTKAIKISISEPCSEEWNNLTIVEQGRFCASCQKVVIDFRKMSDNELLDYFKNHSNNICGNFNPIQTDRFILPLANSSKISRFTKFIASVIGIFLSLTAKSQSIDSIQRKPLVEINPLPTGSMRQQTKTAPMVEKSEQFLQGKMGGVCILPTVEEDKSKAILKNRVFNRIEDILRYF